MKEYEITIEIDEDGSITAETKGTSGEICVTELEEVLKDIEGESGYENKPEYYEGSLPDENQLENR